jgi:hypothetical protein
MLLTGIEHSMLDGTDDNCLEVKGNRDWVNRAEIVFDICWFI